MAAKGGIVFTRWADFRNVVKPARFQKRLEREVGKAGTRNAKIAEKVMRKVIQTGKGLTGNAALTIAIKGEDKPLVDSAGLFQAITSRRVKWNEHFIGVLRASGVFNVAEIVHDGLIIPVSERMRNLFFILWIASLRKADGRPGPTLTGRAAELFERFKSWKPLKPSTRAIKIPARPFGALTVADAALRKRMEREWNRAVERALGTR